MNQVTQIAQMSAKHLVVCAACLLAGCGGSGPSEGDIQGAYKKQMAAEENVGTLQSLKKIGCKEDGKDAYRCDIEVSVTSADFGNKSVAQQIRLVKGSDGWQLSN